MSVYLDVARAWSKTIKAWITNGWCLGIRFATLWLHCLRQQFQMVASRLSTFGNAFSSQTVCLIVRSFCATVELVLNVGSYISGSFIGLMSDGFVQLVVLYCRRKRTAMFFDGCRGVLVDVLAGRVCAPQRKRAPGVL